MSTDDKMMTRQEVEIRIVALEEIRSFFKSHKIKERSKTGQLLTELEKCLTDAFVNWNDKNSSN